MANVEISIIDSLAIENISERSVLFREKIEGLLENHELKISPWLVIDTSI